MKDPTPLRELLGLSNEDELSEPTTIQSPDTGVAHGLACEPTSSVALGHGLPPALLADIEAVPDFSGDDSLRDRLGAIAASRWDRDPRVLLFEGADDVSAAAGGVFVQEDGSVIFDARCEATAVALRSAASEWTVEAKAGAVEVRSLTRAPDAWSASLDGYRPTPAPELDPPDPAALLEGMGPPAWLVEEARALARSAALVDRLASVGLVARLGAASTGSTAEVLERLLAGASSPGDRAARWARELSAEVLDVALGLVVDRAGRLAEELEGLAAVAAEGGERAAAAVAAIRRERDLLESAAWVLDAAGRSDSIETVLDGLDDLAALHLSELDLVGLPDDELLAAVRWQEPDAWWA